MRKSTSTKLTEKSPIAFLLPLHKFRAIKDNLSLGPEDDNQQKSEDADDVIVGRHGINQLIEDGGNDVIVAGEILSAVVDGETYIVIGEEDIAGVVSQSELSRIQPTKKKNNTGLDALKMESRQLLAGIDLVDGELKISVDNDSQTMQWLGVEQDVVEPVGELVKRFSAYSSAELETIADAATRLREEKLHTEAESKLNILAREVIGDLGPSQNISAKGLTSFFATKAKAGEDRKSKAGRSLEKGEVLPDDEKQKIVELIQAFRAAGGKVLFKGRRCVVDLRKTSSMKQHTFRLRTDNHSRDHILSSKSVPKLTFRK